MKLKIRKLNFLTGRPVCLIDEKTAKEMSFHVGHRIFIERNGEKVISIVDTTSGFLKDNEIAVSDEITHILKTKPGNLVEVGVAPRPHSIKLIKKKLKGEKLKKSEIYEIVENIANNSLTETEIAFFISAVYDEGMTLNETKNLTQAMVDSGTKLKLRGKVCDKHCTGGVAGNRTTPIVVAICAYAGLKMPKTSSRAITSASGTADTIETIAKVDFSINEIKKILNKTGACFVWGGSLGLAPVDDKLIRIERIVNIDSESQVLASILSKKISVDSNYIVIDIPYGKSAKFTKRKAKKLKDKFYRIGKKFRLHLDVILTDGSEPIGNGIGPILEMVDVLKILKREEGPMDLEKKSIMLCGKLLELSGKAKKGSGEKMALKILESGKAFEKFKEIIKAQKGDVGKLDGLKFGRFKYDARAKKKMKIKHVNNKLVNKIARALGCPEDKGAGIYLYKKKGDSVEKGDKIMCLYSRSEEKMKYAKKFLRKCWGELVEG